MITDDIVGFFSPMAKLRRIQARKAINIASGSSLSKRKYEGASRGRRTKNWRTTSSSANSEIRGQLPLLRDRSRDLVRNDAYAGRGISIIATNTIGKGILPHITHENKDVSDALNDLWKRWAGDVSCDFDDKKTYYGIQNQSARSMPESGEVLVRRRRTTLSGDQVLPLKLQVLESDFLDSTIDRKLDNGNVIIQGIEFDHEGRRVAYYLFEEHPGNSGLQSFGNTLRFKSNRVPEEDIAHVFREDRPGQIRGIPWLAPIMIRLRDFADFEDAQLMRQKIAACFSIFIVDADQNGELSDQEVEDLEKVEPGAIEYLGSGKDVRFANPPGVENYKEYTSTQLHAFAAGIGISYEALTGDLSEVNFSSARMGWLEFQRNLDSWRTHIINPLLNRKVFGWFKEAAELVGIETQGVKETWTAPRREMIDPTKEIPAKIKAIRSGIQPLSEVIREAGGHIEDVFEDIDRTNKMIDDLDLVLDSDPRQIGRDGQLQLEPNDAEGDNADSKP